MGWQAGNKVTFAATLGVSATHQSPADWRSKASGWDKYTKEIVASSAVAANLGTTQVCAPLQQNGVIWENESKTEAVWPGTSAWPVLWDKWEMCSEYERSVEFTLEPGLNAKLPIYLNTSYAMPYLSCWFPLLLPPICTVDWEGEDCDDSTPNTVPASASSPIGAAMPMDVFPDDVDEFYQLAWDARFASVYQTAGGERPRAVQRDHDGDGLLAKAHGGLDPDDTRWDTDGDGLSDAFELQLRASGNRAAAPSLTSQDTDGDGLCDDQEVRLRTLPNQRDSDGDGLIDGDEVFHPVCGEAGWAGGWTFAYSTTEGLTATVHVTSDPLDPDTDGDGLNDLAEYRLAENPRAWTPSPVGLRLESAQALVKPGATFAYTATVSNNLGQGPMEFISGTLTLSQTIPAEPAAEKVLTSTYHLGRGQWKHTTSTVTVPAETTSEALTLTGRAVGWMHDGDLQPRYQLQPKAPTATRVAVGELAYAGIAPVPVYDPDVDSFAVATVEGRKTAGFSYTRDLIPSDRDDVRSSEVFARNQYDFDFDPGLGQYPPGIACNNQNECLVVFGNTHLDQRSYVWLDALHCDMASDSDTGYRDNIEAYIEAQGAQTPLHGAIFDTEVTLKEDQGHGVKTLVEYVDELRLSLWDRDDPGHNDKIGSDLTLRYSGSSAPDLHLWPRRCVASDFYECEGPPESSSKRFFPYSGKQGYLELFMEPLVSERDGVYGALVQPADKGVEILPIGIDTSTDSLPSMGWIADTKQQPAVATDGQNFLAVWERDLPDAAEVVWTAVYFDKSGGRVEVQEVGPLDHSWAPGQSPHPSISSDFNAYWQAPLHLKAGRYRFTATSDDGMRVHLRGAEGGTQEIIDLWWDHSALTQIAEVNIESEGDYRLEVEYYDAGGAGVARLGWEWFPLDATHDAIWDARYYPCTFLGPPCFTIKEIGVLNNALAADYSPYPKDVQATGFSAHWSTRVDLAPGLYRFTASSDDGMRVYLGAQDASPAALLGSDETRVIDLWGSHVEETQEAVVAVATAGNYPIDVLYYNNGRSPGSARLRVERMDAGGGKDRQIWVRRVAAPETLALTWWSQYTLDYEGGGMSG